MDPTGHVIWPVYADVVLLDLGWFVDSSLWI